MTCEVLSFSPGRRSRFLALSLVLCSLSQSRLLGQAAGFDRDDFAAPRGGRGIVSADLNGDGWVDLAVANTQPGSVAVLLNRGAIGGFALARTVPLSGGPFDIAAGDFNNDGRRDLAVANADGNSIDVLITAAVTATTWNASRSDVPCRPRAVPADWRSPISTATAPPTSPTRPSTRTASAPSSATVVAGGSRPP